MDKKINPIRYFLSSRASKQKGASAIGLLLTLGTVSLVVAGVSIKSDALISAAYDVQGLANVRQLSTALELYYSDFQTYPQVSGDSSLERWEDLIEVLKNEHLLASLPTRNENYDYQDLNSGQNYLIRVLLEDSESEYLENDWDGIIEGIDCEHPYYCLYM